MKAATPKRLGDKLLAAGLISQDQLRIALIEQKRTKEKLGFIFAALGFVTEAVIQDFLGAASGHESINLKQVVVDSEAVKLVPKHIAERYNVVPVMFDHSINVLMLAMADTLDVVALDNVTRMLGGDVAVKALTASEAQIADAIDQFYGFELSVDGILHELETGEVDFADGELESDQHNRPLVRLVNALLNDAVKRGVSDIHLEPEARFLRIRYRIDGVLRQIRIIHINYWPGMVVRIKVMANMNIAETRSPQDGRISLSISGHQVDFRISSHPTGHGENIVLRILNRNSGIVPLAELGLASNTLSEVKLMLARPEGIILVTGPTGSGKTTTLYSLLNHINTESVNIMTLEDPIEYPMNMIRQSAVSEAAKLDFANGIRSMMRQDPDIIFVGEIRDEDTADMAFRAAMTGHQVFSTLHTNSAVGIIPRLLDIGIRPHIMSGNIIGVIGQRLVRKLCQSCKKLYTPNPIEKQLLQIEADQNQLMIAKASGCDQCDHMGYKGRFALIEVLRFDAELDDLIVNNSTLREITAHLNNIGYCSMADAGIRRVREGLTSLDEVSRVVDLTNRIG